MLHGSLSPSRMACGPATLAACLAAIPVPAVPTSSAHFAVTNGTLINTGTIRVDSTNSDSTYSITANINNTGTIIIDDDVAISGTNKTLTNRGTIDVRRGRVTFGNTH